jgi:hypothetical protein
MAGHEIPKQDRANIFLVTAETTLPNDESKNRLLAAIRAIVSPGDDFLLIIDVLRGTMNGSENDDEAAFAWTAAAEILIGEGASILAITHSPYSEDGRMRGHSHLWGSFDTRLQAEGDKDKRTTVLKVNRHKDHDSGGQWGFQLDEVEVEEHPGETSLVPRLDGDVKAHKTKGPRLTKAAKIALDALQYAIDECGSVPPACSHIPSGVKCVTLKQWREYAFKLGISASDEPRTQRSAFQRGTETLIAVKAAVVWGITHGPFEVGSSVRTLRNFRGKLSELSELSSPRTTGNAPMTSRGSHRASTATIDARLATFGSDGSSWGIEAACRMTLSRLKGPSTRAGSVPFLLELEWSAISHRGAPACCLRRGSPAACHWPGAPANPPAFRPRQELRYSTQTIAGRPGRRCPPKSRGDLSAPSRWDPSFRLSAIAPMTSPEISPLIPAPRRRCKPQERGLGGQDNPISISSGGWLTLARTREFWQTRQTNYWE